MNCKILTVLLGMNVLVVMAAQPEFPPARVNEVTDTYFGTQLADPYRSLENVKSDETSRWMRTAATHAEGVLAAISGRDALLARINELESAGGVTIGRVFRVPGDVYVYESRREGDNQFRIVMRRGKRGAERVLVDPQALAREKGGAPQAVNYFSLSPNGRYLAYGVSERGSEAAVLQVLDALTGQSIGEPISRADFGVARWAPDSLHFAFNRLAPDSGDPKTKYENSAVWLLPVRGGMAQAREILGPNTPGVTLRPREVPGVQFSADGRWLIGFLEDGVRREVRVLVAPVKGLKSGWPTWMERIGYDDKIVDFDYGNGQLYAVTYDGAPRYKIVAAPIEHFRAATARTVVPAADKVIGFALAARDALYFEARAGNAKQLWRLPYRAKAEAHQVKLPLHGNFRLRMPPGGAATHPLVDGVVISLEDWTHAPMVYQADADGRVINTGLQPSGKFSNPDDVETEEVLVASHDGARVPLSITYRKGLKMDGRNPTLLQGYGAYGSNSDPRFYAHRLAWIELGGIVAVANPRGSGVFGQAWYEAGKLANKPNTWRDMIACAEFLIHQGYATPTTLAIEGRSAGGITVGRTITERPDLFVAAVAGVGVLDTVRAELESNGPPNIPEFGSHRTEEGFRGLLAMSTYHHIQDGVRYPAVLLLHGVNDPRVDVWQSTKAAARFHAARAGVDGARPVLLRLDYEAGHGVGSTRTQKQREAADTYAFLLWQMGIAGFQPQ